MLLILYISNVVIYAYDGMFMADSIKESVGKLRQISNENQEKGTNDHLS